MLADRGGRPVPESLLDDSVRRVLRDKFALGLFEPPYVHEDPTGSRARKQGGDLTRGSRPSR